MLSSKYVINTNKEERESIYRFLKASYGVKLTTYEDLLGWGQKKTGHIRKYVAPCITPKNQMKTIYI